jgi:hypothetical protein
MARAVCSSAPPLRLWTKLTKLTFVDANLILSVYAECRMDGTSKIKDNTLDLEASLSTAAAIKLETRLSPPPRPRPAALESQHRIT